MLWLLSGLQSAYLNNSPSNKSAASDHAPLRLYRVQVGGKYGYIDRTGHLVIPAQFYRAEEFSEGLAAVGLESSFPEKWGYICSLSRNGTTEASVHLRGRENILKRLLIHIAGFNLSLVLRLITGKDTPRGLQDLQSPTLLL
jgi:WG containing repeat